jgi:hypothetical protein
VDNLEFRNDMYFGRCVWSGLQVIWLRMTKLLKGWTPLEELKFPGTMPATDGGETEGSPSAVKLMKKGKTCKSPLPPMRIGT